MVEIALEKFLKKKMRRISNKLEGRLFDGYGPLSTFSGKIDIAFAFEFIDEPTCNALKALKDARNKLAHSSQLLVFEISDLPEAFRKLKGFKADDPLRSFAEVVKEVCQSLSFGPHDKIV